MPGVFERRRYSKKRIKEKSFFSQGTTHNRTVVQGHNSRVMCIKCEGPLSKSVI